MPKGIMSAVRGRVTRTRAAIAVGVVGLLVAMVLDTTLLNAAEQLAVEEPTFSAATYVAERFAETATMITDKAVDLPVLAEAPDSDAASAGAEHGGRSGTGDYVYAVSATGTVTGIDDRFIEIAIDAMPAGADVRIPLTTALNGAPIRDAPGTAEFGDFANQTDYQAVANEYKLKVQADVIGGIDLATLSGRSLSVIGAWMAGGPDNTFIIQPISLEVSG